MLFYNRVDDSDGIDANKTNESSNCIICYFYYFLKVNFTFQSKVSDGCHDLMQKALSFNDVEIFSAKGNYYR